ncbi:hypothetical protein GJ496_004098 [Pomphorhynchus laevis]|nr:hypothetical protein GJ496_004098 [Pomphorhynchus laevis]
MVSTRYPQKQKSMNNLSGGLENQIPPSTDFTHDNSSIILSKGGELLKFFENAVDQDLAFKQYLSSTQNGVIFIGATVGIIVASILICTCIYRTIRICKSAVGNESRQRPAVASATETNAGISTEPYYSCIFDS